MCNAEHDISTCTQEELYELGLVGPAIMKGPFPFVAPPTGRDGRVVTSIDDIDPNVCNPVHNINACTQEELNELGLVGPAIMKGPFPFVAPITGGDGGVVTSIDDIDSTVCNPVLPGSRVHGGSSLSDAKFK